MIEIRINGETTSCPEGLNLVQMLEHLGYRPQPGVGALNGGKQPRARGAEQPGRAADGMEVVTIGRGG